MKTKQILSIVVLALFSILAVQSCSSEANDSTQKTDPNTGLQPENEIVRGKYLVDIMGCNDCHSPKRMGANGPEIIPELRLSGYPSDRPIVSFDSKLISEGFPMFYPDLTAGAGPWGISFAANLTPDETGIGSWTEEQFKKALTQGKFKGLDNSRMLLPPMPWLNYVDMKDEDIHAIFAYLKSIKAVENIVPAPVSPDKM